MPRASRKAPGRVGARRPRRPCLLRWSPTPNGKWGVSSGRGPKTPQATEQESPRCGTIARVPAKSGPCWLKGANVAGIREMGAHWPMLQFLARMPALKADRESVRRRCPDRSESSELGQPAIGTSRGPPRFGRSRCVSPPGPQPCDFPTTTFPSQTPCGTSPRAEPPDTPLPSADLNLGHPQAWVATKGKQKQSTRTS